MGSEFRQVFDVLFYVTIVLFSSQVTKVLVCPITERTKSSNRMTWSQRFCPHILQLLIYLCRILAILILLVALKFRFSHAGSVCSGDYLEASDPPEGYLIEQGFFLKLQAYFLAALLLSLCIVTCFEEVCSKKRH